MISRGAVAVSASFVGLLLGSLSGCSLVLGSSNAGIEALESSRSPAGEIAAGGKLAGWVLGAPLDLGALPFALAAWVSPWGDLPLFADVLTAPSIGTGYALEAVVGAPGAAIAACLGDEDETAPVASETEAWQPPVGSLLPWGLVVDHRPARQPARAARALAPEDVAAYAVPAGAAEALASSIESAGRARDDDEPVAVSLSSYGFEGTLEVSWAEDDERAPLVVLTPPSQGTFAARYLARRYARRGFHAAVLVPDGDYLVPGLDPDALEAKLRGALVAARTVVAALGTSPRVSRVVYLGISAGGIFGALLLAVEPRVERAALIFPGGDIPLLAATSEESTVRDFRESWAERGVDAAALRRVLAATIKTDPIRLAPSIDPGRVLLFLADSDTLVPLPCGLALREALGQPETWLISGQHEVAGCSFGFVLHEADGFLLGTSRP